MDASQKEKGEYYKFAGYPNSNIPLIDDKTGLCLYIICYLILAYFVIIRLYFK